MRHQLCSPEFAVRPKVMQQVTVTVAKPDDNWPLAIVQEKPTQLWLVNDAFNVDLSATKALCWHQKCCLSMSDGRCPWDFLFAKKETARSCSKTLTRQVLYLVSHWSRLFEFQRTSLRQLRIFYSVWHSWLQEICMVGISWKLPGSTSGSACWPPLVSCGFSRLGEKFQMSFSAWTGNISWCKFALGHWWTTVPGRHFCSSHPTMRTCLESEALLVLWTSSVPRTGIEFSVAFVNSVLVDG